MSDTNMLWAERAIKSEMQVLGFMEENKNLREQVANLHSFLDEIWLTYKLSTAFRQRILLAKAQRWDQALLGVTLTEADYELIRQGSNAYANRTVNPGTEHTEALLPQETGESFGI